MNPSWIKTQADRQKVYKEYMSSLQQETANINKTANALKTKELTGAPPVQVQDTRTTTEKYMDIYRLRNELESGLYKIMSPDEAQKVVNQLSEDEIQFGRTQLEAIVKDLKPKFALGVPAVVFTNYLRKLLQTFVATEGVERAQQGVPSNALLSSFAEIRETKLSLERLQKLMEEANRTYRGGELVPYTGMQTKLNEIIDLLPSAEELQLLRQADINLRAEVYDFITEFERVFPDQNTLERTIDSLFRAIQSKDVETYIDIMKNIEILTAVNQEQIQGLRQLRNIIDEQSQAVVPMEQRAGGRRVEPEGEQVIIRRKGKKPKQQAETGGEEPPSPEVSRQKNYSLEEAEYFEPPSKDYEPLIPSQRQRIENLISEVGGFPISREEFIKLTPPSRKADYIAYALDIGALPENATGFVKEKGANGFYKMTSLFPRGVIEPGRHKAEQLIMIFDEYLQSSAPQAEAIQEVSGSPVPRIFRGPMKEEEEQSVRSGMTSVESRSVAPRGRGIKGRGISNRVEGRLQGTHEPKSVYSFAPFGRYVINTNKLQKNVLTINTKTGKSVPKLKSKLISKDLANIFKIILRGETPDNELTMKLNKEEADLLYHSLNESHLLGKHNITTDTLSKTEQELHRFNVLRGQILAGQNNEKVLREFKSLLLKYVNSQQIPRGEAYEILQEMLVLGY